MSALSQSMTIQKTGGCAPHHNESVSRRSGPVNEKNGIKKGRGFYAPSRVFPVVLILPFFVGNRSVNRAGNGAGRHAAFGFYPETASGMIAFLFFI